MTTYYVYDYAGFFTHSTDQQLERSTEIAPANLTVTEVPGELRSNWTGVAWQEIPFVAVPAPASSAGNPWEWFIDIGPFFDRFGAQKIPVLASTDATVQAILRDVQVRKWVDLKRPDVAQSLAYIGSKVVGLTPAMQQTILNSPVLDAENLALRKMYFS